MQEIYKVVTYLTGLNNVLRTLYLSGSLVDQVTFLVRGAARKDKYLASFRTLCRLLRRLFM